MQKTKGQKVSNYKIESFFHAQMSRAESDQFLDEIIKNPSLKERIELRLMTRCSLTFEELSQHLS